jgi:hypothetical protein
VIPNDANTSRNEWNDVGMRFWAASGGSEDGCEAFVAFSLKSPRCTSQGRTARERWRGITSSPPTRYDANSLLKEARRYDRTFPDPLDLARQDVDCSEMLARLGTVAEQGGGPASGAGQFPPFLTASDFIAGYQPQPPLVRDWCLRPGRFYSFTAPTGNVKTAIALAEAVTLALEGKCVVYLAGENPDDIRERVILMTDKLGLEQPPPNLHFVADTYDLHKGYEHTSGKVKEIGGADIIYVDTSPAFQSASGGEDENDNAKQIAWARHLRKLTRLAGNPAVVALCHPIKRPLSHADCLPRGGGSFLAEVDGNYTSWKVTEDGENWFFELHWAGKFRGRFDPIIYKTEIGTCEGLRDTRGNHLESVWACRTQPGDVSRAVANQTKDEDAVLVAMANNPNSSLSQLAEAIGWRMRNGQPYKKKVERAIKELAKVKAPALVKLARGGKWTLTKQGEEAASDAREHVKLYPVADFSALIANMTGAK